MIKNYTSNVEPEDSVARIEAMLVEVGASHISKEYSGNREIQGISFMIKNPAAEGKLAFRIPAHIGKVRGVLDRQQPAKGKLNKDQAARRTQRLNDQSRRTAWKLVHDWVELQLAMIAMEQAELMEVFLPYLWTGRESFYEKLKGQQFIGITDRSTPTDEVES